MVTKSGPRAHLIIPQSPSCHFEKWSADVVYLTSRYIHSTSSVATVLQSSWQEIACADVLFFLCLSDICPKSCVCYPIFAENIRAGTECNYEEANHPFTSILWRRLVHQLSLSKMSIQHSKSNATSLTEPKLKWDDIDGLERAKDVLQAEIVLAAKLPHLFNGLRKPRNSILLYGPLRTRMSCLAEAAANEAGLKLVKVNCCALNKS